MHFQNSECHQQHLLEPVGDRHHYIERSQEEDKMEVRVAVDGTLPLVIQHILAWASLLLIIVILKKEKLQKDAEKNVQMKNKQKTTLSLSYFCV